MGLESIHSFPFIWDDLDDHRLNTEQQVTPDCSPQGVYMKTRINQSKSGNSLLITFHEGFSTYTITVPMPYAIQFFVEGLVTSLETLKGNPDAQKNLDGTQGQKAQIQEFLRKALLLYDQFLAERKGRPVLNEQTELLRLKLLRRYYKSAVLGWSIPRSLHWSKVVTSEGFWKWTKPHQGIRGRLVKHPPLHIYQTVCKFKTEDPLRGNDSKGYLLGGPMIFDADLTDKREPFSLWKLMDSAEMVQELIQTLRDRGEYYQFEVLFSGMRGIHVLGHEDTGEIEPIQLTKKRSSSLRSHIRKRFQTARSIGKWCKGWDWLVSMDMWRVSRVPWSIHGTSALRAIPLKKPYTAKNFKLQLQAASPFSLERKARIRMKRSVPLFTFIDGETYGPFRKGWATKLPIAVALHLIWQDFARPRESGLTQAGAWFDRGWQILFRSSGIRKGMDSSVQVIK
ncbi:MAG: hypothetical protein ACTSSE_16695 [Candidatus Thorarchaeota archaeon]